MMIVSLTRAKFSFKR